MPAGSDPATILVVEDDAVLGQVLGRILTDDGYAVCLARSTSEAIKQVQEQHPRLVLLDTCLRDGKGRELAECLRSEHSNLPLILLTSHPPDQSDFPNWSGRLLTKSIDLPDLRRSVASALAESDCKNREDHSADWPGNIAADATDETAHPRPVVAADSDKTSMADNMTTIQESAARENSALSQGKPQPVRNTKEPVMRVPQSKLLRAAGVVLLVLVAVMGLAAANGSVRLPWSRESAENDPAPAQKTARQGGSVELVKDQPHTLFIPEDARKALGIRKGDTDLVYVVKKPTRKLSLKMPGSIMFDPGRLVRIRALFAPSPSSARVVEIATRPQHPTQSGQTRTIQRELRTGDRVVKGETLAVANSVEVGNKKNELIDAIYQKTLDEAILKRAEAKSESMPLVSLLNMQKNVQSDANAINKALSTLKTWGISEEDIQAVLDEAEKVKARKGTHDKSKDALWPRVEIKAPLEGVVLEKNASVGEVIADNTTNLFQVADIDVLNVTANCPEDDMPKLRALPDQLRRWTIKTVGSPDIEGDIDDIGYIVDPNDHTVKVKGHIDNRDRILCATQFVSATVDLAPPPDVVEVPMNAVVDDGQQSIVFVQTDAARQYYTMRRVELVGRFETTAFVRSKPFEKNEQLTTDEAVLAMLPKEPLRVGDRILESGVGELKALLLDKETQPQTKDTKGG